MEDEAKKKEKNLQLLDDISKLEKDWNLYQSDPIPESVINRVRNFLETVPYQPDAVIPVADESIQLEFWGRKTTVWRLKFLRIQLGI